MRRSLLLLCCLLGACGESGPPTPGTPIGFDTVCDKANDGKRVMLEGYLEFPQSFGAKDSSVMLRVRPSLDSWEKVVGIQANLGDATNNVAMPPLSFRKSDLKLHLADGKSAGYQDKVKVSGTMYLPSSMAQVEFKCGLSNPLFEASGQ